MDDLMISALGSNELLSGVAKKYNKLKGEQKEEICAAFITVLVHDLNDTVFENRPINLNVYASNGDNVGGFNVKDGENEAVGFNVANIGKNIDEVVGTLKHEILGHYIDKHYTNIGLQGDAMRKFVSEQLVNNNDEIFCHGHIYTDPELIVISPLLKQRYQLKELKL